MRELWPGLLANLRRTLAWLLLAILNKSSVNVTSLDRRDLPNKSNKTAPVSRDAGFPRHAEGSVINHDAAVNVDSHEAQAMATWGSARSAVSNAGFSESEFDSDGRPFKTVINHHNRHKKLKRKHVSPTHGADAEVDTDGLASQPVTSDNQTNKDSNPANINKHRDNSNSTFKIVASAAVSKLKTTHRNLVLLNQFSVSVTSARITL